MYKNLFRNLNLALFVFIAIFAVILQSTVLDYFPVHLFKPDFVIILIAYFGFKRSLIEGGFFAIIISIVVSAHTSAQLYFFLFVYLYVFLLSKFLSRLLVVPNIFSISGIVAGLSVFKKIAIYFLFGLLGKSQLGLKSVFLQLVLEIFVQALLTGLCFKVFYRIDLLTYKDVRAEDEYDINKEF